MSDFRPALIFAGAIALVGVQGSAQSYSARRSGDVVQLRDERAQTIVSILPSVGNIAFEMNVKGQNILPRLYSSADDFKARPGMSRRTAAFDVRVEAERCCPV